eukprot:486119_1
MTLAEPNNKIISLTYQTTSKVKTYDQSTRKFEYEITQLKQFHLQYSATSSFQKVTLKWLPDELLNLKQQIKCYSMKTNQNENITNQIINQIDTKYANKSKLFQFEIERKLSFDILKHHFSRFMFKNIIPANCIQIYKNTSMDICDKYTLKPTSILSLGIVPYDTINRDSYKDRILTVTLYPETQAPFPFTITKIERKPLKITINLPKKSCTVKNIIDEIIKISKKPMFEHQFNEMKQTFDSYVNTIKPNCYGIVTDYKYVQEEQDDYNYSFYKEPYYYYQYHRILYESQLQKCIKGKNDKLETIKNIEIFMIPDMGNTLDSFEHKLTIRFAWCNEFNNGNKGIRQQLIGVPLFVWCNDDDTLYDILNNNPILQKFTNDIVDTYEIAEYYEIVSHIPKGERISFEIYEDLLSHDDSNFIVITLKKTDNIFVSCWNKGILLSHADLYE